MAAVPVLLFPRTSQDAQAGFRMSFRRIGDSALKVKRRTRDFEYRKPEYRPARGISKSFTHRFLVQFDRSHSHRGFSPVSGRRNKTGNRLNGFQVQAQHDHAALRRQREWEVFSKL